MIEELEQLSLALSQISTVQAKRVASVVNDKIVKLVDAQVAKLYWNSEAQNGVLLTPVAFVNRERQFADPMPFQITESDRGILSYVRETRRPVWLERLTEQDLTDTPVLNESQMNRCQESIWTWVPIRGLTLRWSFLS